MRLIEDIQLCSSLPLGTDTIMINSGTQMLREPVFNSQQDYIPGVFIPKNGWSRLSQDDFGNLVSNNSSVLKDPGRSIFLTKIPESLLHEFYNQYLSVITPRTIGQERALLNKKVLPRISGKTVEFLQRQYVNPAHVLSQFILLNRRCQNGNIPSPLSAQDEHSSDTSSSTYDGGGMVGMHVDNWGVPRLIPEEQGKAGVRFVMNAGIEDR